MSDHTHGEYEISENQQRYYTPTTEVVEANYEYSNWLQRAGDREQYEAEFNRWLAEVKAQAVAEWRAERDAKFNKLTVDTLRQGEEQ